MLDFAEARGCITQMDEGRLDGFSVGFENQGRVVAQFAQIL